MSSYQRLAGIANWLVRHVGVLAVLGALTLSAHARQETMGNYLGQDAARVATQFGARAHYRTSWTNEVPADAFKGCVSDQSPLPFMRPMLIHDQAIKLA